MNNNKMQQELGAHIMSLRKKRKLSRSELAEGICSVSYISKIENDIRVPSSIILVQIAKKLGVTPDYLLDEIEAENPTELKSLISYLVLLIERHSFKGIYTLISEKEKDYYDSPFSLSFLDLQFIETLKTYSYYMLNKNYSEGLEKVKKVLDMTYIPGNTPTEIEFAILELYGFFLMLDGRIEDAYTALSSIEKYVDEINFIRTYFIVPRYYSHFIMTCLETNRLAECERLLEFIIDYCKRKNTHNTLRELYYLKSELFFKQGDLEASKVWYTKAFQLHDLIKTSDYEYFEDFVKHRVEKLK